jgi:uncharacterized membrane protein YidH (DUF202 family)
MNAAKVVGLLLVIVGVVALLYSGVTYTRREKIVDLGPVQIEKKTTERIPIPPIVGGLALVGGIVLVLSNRGSGDRRAV